MGNNQITKERIASIAKLVGTLYALVQGILSITGKVQIPYTQDQVVGAVTLVLGVVGVLWMWWKPSPVTEAGVKGKQLTAAIKLAQKTGNDSDHESNSGPIFDVDINNKSE